jgi:hypothetical protein
MACDDDDEDAEEAEAAAIGVGGSAGHQLGGHRDAGAAAGVRMRTKGETPREAARVIEA